MKEKQHEGANPGDDGQCRRCGKGQLSSRTSCGSKPLRPTPETNRPQLRCRARQVRRARHALFGALSPIMTDATGLIAAANGSDSKGR